MGHRFPGGPWLFQNLTLVLEPGQTYALTGPSGSGKSTLLGILAGFTAPATGRVEIEGSAKLHWVFQNPYGMPRRTAIDHVAFAAAVSGVAGPAADRRAAELLERFGLAHVADRQFRRLSGGEGMRLMLARAIAANPDILLVDEPTGQLDLSTAERVNDVIVHLAGSERIVVVASHDPATVARCSDRIDLRMFRPDADASPT